MNPAQHHSNTRVLNAPAGWNQSQLPVGALPVTDTVQAGVPTVLSFWRPDAEELARLNAGGMVCLSVIGRNMPPVSIIAWKGPITTANEQGVNAKSLVGDDVTGKYCYSTDEESFHGRFTTAEDAHGQAQQDILDDTTEADNGQSRDYWIARCCHPLDCIKSQIGDDIMDMLEQRMADEVAAEEECLSISKQDEIDLSNLVLDFIRARAVVQYYGVANFTKHAYVIGSDQ